MVDQIIQCLGLYPVGNWVKLNTGKVAVVIEQDPVRRLKPRVMIAPAPDHTPNRYPATLNLFTDPMVDEYTPYRVPKALPMCAFVIDPKEFYL